MDWPILKLLNCQQNDIYGPLLQGYGTTTATVDFIWFKKSGVTDNLIYHLIYCKDKGILKQKLGKPEDA